MMRIRYICIFQDLAFIAYIVQDVRNSESLVAGHSDDVFLGFYNTRASQASHVLISALQVIILTSMFSFS